MLSFVSIYLYPLYSFLCTTDNHKMPEGSMLRINTQGSYSSD